MLARLQLSGEPGQHGCVDAVGLGQQPHRPGEVADRSGVYEGHRQAHFQEPTEHVTLVSAGGLDGNAIDRVIRQFLQQASNPFLVIAELDRTPDGIEVNVQVVLADVDADSGSGSHEVRPFLADASSPRRLWRLSKATPITPNSGRGTD